MRKILIGLVLTASLVATLQAYAKFEQITVADAVIGFTDLYINASGEQSASTLAVCRLKTAQINFTIDGTTPTTTVGTPLEIGDQVVVSGAIYIQNFRAIRTGSTSGVLACVYSAE